MIPDFYTNLNFAKPRLVMLLQMTIYLMLIEKIIINFNERRLEKELLKAIVIFLVYHIYNQPLFDHRYKISLIKWFKRGKQNENKQKINP